MDSVANERIFADSGHDLWGYDSAGHYDPRFDLAPFQQSPFQNCAACDAERCSA